MQAAWGGLPRRPGETDLMWQARMAEMRAQLIRPSPSSLAIKQPSRGTDTLQRKQALQQARRSGAVTMRPMTPQQRNELGEQIAECVAGMTAATGGLIMSQLPTVLEQRQGVSLREIKEHHGYFSQRQLVEEVSRGKFDVVTDPQSKTGDIVIFPLGAAPRAGQPVTRASAAAAAAPMEPASAAPAAGQSVAAPAGMQMCCECGQARPRASFSGTQLARPTAKRRCPQCVERALGELPPPKRKAIGSPPVSGAAAAAGGPAASSALFPAPEPPVELGCPHCGGVLQIELTGDLTAQLPCPLCGGCFALEFD
eukprot:TRINITY_DN4354_c3_g1_i1.p1 TRINITY_DN4354_c3_g1~~TRINITY_DN4354_c3_g1_i1.p1  ORF type:complete len:335 (+),score=98.93 TRINITY_DN4354_c3_g1_i1:75-1007(+)